jgi:hypothetical protein
MIIERHSPSSLNLFCASPSMWVLEKILKVRQPVGAPAFRGTGVEDGVTVGLLDPNASLESCIEAALKKYDTISALSGDARREKYRETIPDMVTGALAELRPYGVPSKVQGFVEWKPEGLQYPVVGYFDYEWAQHGIIVDLKTSDKLTSAIKIPHARQVALYCTSDNTDARLTYATPTKKTPGAKSVATYKLENIRDHRQALFQIAVRLERFLTLSEDPEFYTQITVPDLESFYWSGPARQIAFDRWGI